MDKLSKLLFALLDRTKQGLIAWQETADEDVFQYSTAESTIRIENIGNLYYVSVLNKEGRVIENVSNHQLDKSVEFDILFDGPSNHFQLMQVLYDAARRKALKADATLDGILSQLGVKA